MNPIHEAKQLADRLEADPIVAAQIKEHVKPIRLLELLDLPQIEVETYLRLNSYDLQKD
jgi:hypothetical protein